MCLIRVNMVSSLNATMPCRTNNKSIFPCSLQEQNTTKVRKPYTITKQREKWTGDEHQKFLEAIKLHGRAWKSVEEHIGTKNAAQIRSHAQKFFTKVVRELTNGNTGSIIEVPPPRPKKKSTHPYPRKSDICDKAYPPLVHLIPDEVNASEDNKLDDTMGSSASVAQSNTNLSESCISRPISPISRSTDHKNNGGNWGLVSASFELNPEDHHVVEHDNTCVKSFQLFGATIIVADVNISSSVHPRQDTEEVNKLNAAANRETVYDCSHGLLPFFDFASDMDLAAAPVALAKLSISNCHI